MDTRIITNSELNCFRRCRRKWWLSYYRKLAPLSEKTTGVRGLGTRIHSGLAAYYSAPADRRDPLEVFRESFAEELANEELSEEQRKALNQDFDLGYKMITGYLQWVEETGADAGLEVYASEQKVQVDFATLNGVLIILLGKLDARALREWDNSRWFIDHKSVGSLTAPLETLQSDTQMLQYHALERGVAHWDELCHGGMYNMMRRVKRTANAKPPFYAREEIRHNEEEIKSYGWHLIGVMEDIMRVEEKLAEHPNSRHHLIVYPSPRQSCSWECEFKLVCPMFDDGSHAEGMLDAYYRVHDPLERYAAEEEVEHA